ncbi:MAG: hypothetical protein WCK65_15390, partial [Rhodospirillaceae bacterium]
MPASPIPAPSFAPSSWGTATDHGGNLGAARRRFPNAPEPWLDLSTGINPWPYPLPQLTPEVWQRLPDYATMECLAAAAAGAY